jgi:hypothetical protein
MELTMGLALAVEKTASERFPNSFIDCGAGGCCWCCIFAFS